MHRRCGPIWRPIFSVPALLTSGCVADAGRSSDAVCSGPSWAAAPHRCDGSGVVGNSAAARLSEFGWPTCSAGADRTRNAAAGPRALRVCLPQEGADDFEDSRGPLQ
eukprot:4934794-Pyramimonas_sp.AAC.1